MARAVEWATAVIGEMSGNVLNAVGIDSANVAVEVGIARRNPVNDRLPLMTVLPSSQYEPGLRGTCSTAVRASVSRRWRAVAMDLRLRLWYADAALPVGDRYLPSLGSFERSPAMVAKPSARDQRLAIPACMTR